MTVLDQPYTTYSDTTPQKRVITDVISLIDPTDAPFIEKIGGLDGASGKFRFVNGKSTHPEWLHDDMPPLTSTLATATIASNATSATVADASVFQPGHIIQMNAQQFWVSAVDLTNNVLTMTSLGGTGTSHATGATISIVGMARLEGDDSDASPSTDRSSASNYTNIFHGEIKVARTQNQISQYGIGREFDYQANKVIPGLMRQMELMVLRNAIIAAGSASTPRVMGGIPAFLTTNSTSGATLSRAKFEAATKLAFADGGVGPWFAPLSATNYERIRKFLENTGFLRVSQDEKVVGMAQPDVIRTAFGDVYPILDRWADDSNIYLVDIKHVGMLTLQPFTQEPLAKTGDTERGQVIGEFTLCVREPAAHAYLTSVSDPA